MIRLWAECTPSYYNNEGKANTAIARSGGFGGGVPLMVEIFNKWREANKLEGLELASA